MGRPRAGVWGALWVPQGNAEKLASYQQEGNTKLLSAVERLAIEAATVG